MKVQQISVPFGSGNGGGSALIILGILAFVVYVLWKNKEKWLAQEN